METIGQIRETLGEKRSGMKNEMILILFIESPRKMGDFKGEEKRGWAKNTSKKRNPRPEPHVDLSGDGVRPGG